MNKLKDNELDPRLLDLLDELKPVPARDSRVAARARAHFLAEAVSRRDQQRHSLWTIFQQKEQLAMKLVLFMLVIAGLLFGGSATVSAAQDDLPNEPLYQIKLVSEDVNLWLASDPAAQIELLMDQAQTRTQEMAALVQDGVTPPAELGLRAQERIQLALQFAANLEEPSCTATLQHIQMQLQTQEQLMKQLQDGSCANCEPILQQTREMLRNQLRKVESKLAQPQSAPGQIQNQNQNQYQNQLGITQTPPAVEEPVMAQDSCTPVQDATGQQNGAGNPSSGTPMPRDNSMDQNGGGMQNGPGNGGGSQDDNDSGNTDGGGNNSGSGGGGQGGRP